MPSKRYKLLVKGTVQGVGFRPYVFNLAKQFRLTGFVHNQGDGVAIEIQGSQANYFKTQLPQSLPKLAIIEDILTQEIALIAQEDDFVIMPSKLTQGMTLISPDINVCDDCLTDLYNANSHYHRYPFINCTQCGPRFSIIHSLPYDRHHTSMSQFHLCTRCQTDYDNPCNRRHHAQPTACVECGPTYSLSIADMAKKIEEGQILAIKSLGGYQLICDGHNQDTLTRLRNRKNRPFKPLAVMVSDLADASFFVKINEAESAQLNSDARPIVLLNKYNDNLAEILAPGLNQLGMMLPSTPFHHLLMDHLTKNPQRPRMLVITSANRPGDPILIDDDDAKHLLNDVADDIVAHNRKIVAHVDDSVIQMIDEKPIFVRRARGYVPNPIKLNRPLPPILALGASQKNTICIIRDDQAFVSQYIGSLSSPLSIDYFEQTIKHWLNLLNVTPEYLAHDCHPDFYSSRWAEQHPLPNFAIQHHHSHLASVIAEHQITTPCLGLALDGYGYGPNGEIWGGELMRLDEAICQHLGQLEPLAMIGGEQAIREPWRMAAAFLHQTGRRDEILPRFGQLPMAKPLLQLLDSQQIKTAKTSSCGRLFDTAAALVGIGWQSSYEGQAAMQLESLVTKPSVLPNGWIIGEHNLSLIPLLHHLVDCHSPESGANLFHGTLITAITDWVVYHCQKQGINQVVLSGGCITNRVLASGLNKALKQQNILVYFPHRLPANDGGISLGQAWVTGLLVS
ncbi:carbamoyltransferase HypF [Legionella sp. W05-934-2]|uniref:carbamoyltransferase HypF n=1 Tax=Legionella sp. W05-934-2 TaxID=1198649 RepID=UPI0034635D4A